MSERAGVIKMAVKAGLRDMKSIRNFYDDSLKYADGGPKPTNREYKSTNSWNPTNIGKTLAPILEPISRAIMNKGEAWAFPTDYDEGVNLSNSTAQDTYLLPRSTQRAVFESRGYEYTPQDYGLVRKAVGNRNIPVYQKAPDDITRDKVVPTINVMAEDTIDDIENWFGKSKARLEDPGHFPTTFYLSTDGKKVYQKGWDLNDYADGADTWYQSSKAKQLAAKGIDLIGSPTVTTTGISEVGDLSDLYEEFPRLVTDMLDTKGLVPLKVGNDYIPSLPEVTITGKKKRKVK